MPRGHQFSGIYKTINKSHNLLLYPIHTWLNTVESLLGFTFPTFFCLRITFSWTRVETSASPCVLRKKGVGIFTSDTVKTNPWEGEQHLLHQTTFAITRGNTASRHKNINISWWTHYDSIRKGRVNLYLQYYVSISFKMPIW